MQVTYVWMCKEDKITSDSVYKSTKWSNICSYSGVVRLRRVTLVEKMEMVDVREEGEREESDWDTHKLTTELCVCVCVYVCECEYVSVVPWISESRASQIHHHLCSPVQPSLASVLSHPCEAIEAVTVRFSFSLRPPPPPPPTFTSLSAGHNTRSFFLSVDRHTHWYKLQ